MEKQLHNLEIQNFGSQSFVFDTIAAKNGSDVNTHTYTHTKLFNRLASSTSADHDFDEGRDFPN